MSDDVLLISIKCQFYIIIVIQPASTSPIVFKFSHILDLKKVLNIQF